MFDAILYRPIFNTLLFFYNLFNHNLGLAIIALTLLVRFITLPLTLPAIRSAQKMKTLKPLFDELKEKHKNDKKQLQQAQLELYRQHGLNPTLGCFPTLIQIVVLFILYRVFTNFLQGSGLNSIQPNTQFLWLNLTQPDPYFILPLGAGLTQLLLSLMLKPGVEHHQSTELKHPPRSKAEKEKAEDVTDMAEAMQQQTLFVMPLITVIFAWRFPSGLALYWVVGIIFSIIQQYYISGLGGLQPYLVKIGLIKNQQTT